MRISVGSKVVCVNSDFSGLSENNRKVFKQLPTKGTVYTVREFDDPSIKLEEIVNPVVEMDVGGIRLNQEGAFHKNRFAPLLEDRDELTESILEDIEFEELEDIEYR